MKILIPAITFSKNEGGAIGIAYQQAVKLNKMGYEVFVFAGTEGSDLGWQEENGIKIYKIKNKRYRYIVMSYLCLFNFRVQREFKQFLKEIKPDVIHFHNLYFQLPFYLLKIAKKSKKSGSKVFFTAHDVMTFSQQKLTFFIDKKWNLQNIDQVNYKFPLLTQLKQSGKAFNPFRNFFIRHYLKYCNKIFAVSYELKKALEQNGIKNIKVIHNGIDIENWVSDKIKAEEIKNNLKLKNKKVILFAGRLSGAKGGEVMIDVMAKVIKEVPETILLVLGDRNSFVDELEELILDCKLENNIIFTGYIDRSNMKNYYALASIVVIPSICFDSFPTVNLEAMSCKKPVIASCFGGSREVIVNEKTGFIINPMNIDIFSNKIIYLLNEEEKAIKLGEDGFERIKKDFSEEIWINKIIHFYK